MEHIQHVFKDQANLSDLKLYLKMHSMLRKVKPQLNRIQYFSKETPECQMLKINNFFVNFMILKNRLMFKSHWHLNCFCDFNKDLFAEREWAQAHQAWAWQKSLKD